MAHQMKNMTLENIANACKGIYVGSKEDKNKTVSGVALDSRKIENNFLFIATKGERVDGHSFITQVFEMGAVCVVCEKAPMGNDNPYILVGDSFLALQQIATFYRMQLAIKVVGVTGSVGKTSTKEFIASVLEKKYKVLKTKGNFNNEIGLPLTVLQIKDEHEVAVLEMGINHFGEMDRLGLIAKPDIGVFTNIGQCHLEFLGTRRGILKAKTEMIPHVSTKGMICINGDDEMLATVSGVTDIPLTSFGFSKQNQIFVKEVENKGLFGSDATIVTGQGEFRTTIPLPGRHMIYNAMAATAVGLAMNLSFLEIEEGIKMVPPVSGRSNLLLIEERTIIDDCYNANPVSMKAAIDLLSLSKERKVAVLGDMGELGENARKIHEDVGKYAVDAKIDVLICIGEYAYFMAEEAKKENVVEDSKVYYFESIEKAKQEFDNLFLKKDTILVKASRFMQFERIVKALSE